MSGIIEIEVINWENYNPRTDRKKHSWFRLENNIVSEPKFHGLSAAQKFIAICLLAEASKGSGRAKIIVSWLCDQLKVKSLEISKTLELLVSNGVVRVPPDTGNTHNFQSSLTTNERTNERTVAPSVSEEPLGAAIVEFVEIKQTIEERKISRDVQMRWIQAFPDIPWAISEVKRALAWEAANPTKRKKNFASFMTRWLSKAWDQRMATKTTINLIPLKIEGIT